jgi:hypothetical protein
VSSPGPGTVFPTEQLRTADGQPVLPPNRETLYAVFHTECPTSELAWPYLERLHRLGGAHGLRVVGVSQDAPGPTEEFLRGLGVCAEVLYDPEPWNVSEALELSSVPAFALVGHDGLVRDLVAGFQREKIEGFAARSADLSGRPRAGFFRPEENVPAIRPG